MGNKKKKKNGYMYIHCNLRGRQPNNKRAGAARKVGLAPIRFPLLELLVLESRDRRFRKR